VQSATLGFAEKLPQRCFQRMRQMQSKKVSGNKGVCALKRRWQADQILTDDDDDDEIAHYVI